MSAMAAAARVFPAQRIALRCRRLPAHVADVRAAGEKALAGVEREEEVVHGLGHIL